ncbi:hypothetical protein J1D01_01990 [Seonamhaeicola sp. NFXS20]|uniref:hypothetical protein n=1 Tax=unclassified Seonamhaeicola TaxID=2622645 RepID=UPI000972DDB3|nr:hypothetical protein [Seonamhaeicola sp. S2-3]APY11222.1 hypothetical protein BWZ22_08180 [Seonamhaeicola sp. S2-3]
MKNILLIFLLTIFSCSENSEIKPYVDYLKKIEKKSAKDYILQQFKKHDIVILCERNHSEFSQYELIKDVLTDEYFKKNVKNIFIENGIINLQPEITEFLKSKDLDSISIERKITKFQQNASFWFIWERYNFNYLLKTIYDVNNTSENQISLYPSDSEFDWNKVHNVEDYEREQDFEIEPRDSIIAYNIINQFESIEPKAKKKALVILNYRHAFKIHTIRSNGELQQNSGKFLSDYFGNRVVSILINCPIFSRKEQKWEYELIQNGKWDASFKKQKIDDIGFDFNNSIFGNDDFDMWNGMEEVKYNDVFDGFVFYKPIEKHKLIDNFNGMISKDFEEEMFRRLKIQSEYFENNTFLEKLEDEDFKENFVKELNTKKIKKYPTFEKLLESRDKHLND